MVSLGIEDATSRVWPTKGRCPCTGKRWSRLAWRPTLLRGNSQSGYARLAGATWRRDTGQHNDRAARAEAERLLREAAGQAAPTGLDWPGAAQAYLAALQTGPLDRRAQADRLGVFARTVSGPVPSTVEQARDVIGRWLAAREGGGYTLRNYRVAVSRLCAWLIRERRVPWLVNPAAAGLHPKPRMIARAPEVPAEADVRRLLDAAKNAPELPVLALVLSGLRPGSACRCRWEQITPAGVRVCEKGRERVVPLSGWVKKALDVCREASASAGLALAGPIYTRGGYREVQRQIAAFRSVLGLPASVTLQGLRRAADQRLYQAGVAPQLAAQVLGHSPQTAARHYVDWRGLDASAAVAALDWGGETSGKERGKKPAPKSPTNATLCG